MTQVALRIGTGKNGILNQRGPGTIIHMEI